MKYKDKDFTTLRHEVYGHKITTPYPYEDVVADVYIRHPDGTTTAIGTHPVSKSNKLVADVINSWVPIIH